MTTLIIKQFIQLVGLAALIIGAILIILGTIGFKIIYILPSSNLVRILYENIDISKVNYRNKASLVLGTILLIVIQSRHEQQIVFSHGLFSLQELLVVLSFIIAVILFFISNKRYEQSKGPPQYRSREHAVWVMGLKSLLIGLLICYIGWKH